MFTALQLSPMIPSYNIPETARFFSELLNFSMLRNDDHYMIMYKDKLSIHILNAGTDIGEMEFYLEVDDVNGLWDTIKNKLEGIKMRAPFDRDYGMREMHIIVPYTKTLLFVGQVIK